MHVVQSTLELPVGKVQLEKGHEAVVPSKLNVQEFAYILLLFMLAHEL